MMQRCMKSLPFTLVLILVLLATPLPPARAVARVAAVQPALPSASAVTRVQAQPATPPTIRSQASASKTLFLPVIRTPFGPPAFTIISPGNGWTISGMTYFAVQSLDPAAISSVTFKAGATTLGVDTTPQDGLKVFLNAKTFPAGALTLTATASGPGGQTTQTISVNVVPNPPASATVGAQGGVLASQIGSVITIPPGALPNGTNVSVNELTQAQTTAATGFDWDAMGVTFLGAQDVQSSAAFAQPLGVASAGFGNRVQPGQAVVNYRIMPDADGDGVGELVVVNTASVAPNNDVISDPVPQILLESVPTASGAQTRLVAPTQAGFGGLPGTTIKIRGSGFNPASLASNVASWHSSASGQTFEMPGLALPDPLDNSRQMFSTVIPPLPAGSATLTLRNRSTGSTTASLAVSIGTTASLTKPAVQIIDEYLATTSAYFRSVPTSLPEEAVALNKGAGYIDQARTNMAHLISAGLTPELNQGLNIIAQIIENSNIYHVGSSLATSGASPSRYDAETKANDVIGLLGSIAGTLLAIEQIITATAATTLFGAIGAPLALAVGVIATLYFACKLIRGGNCFGEPPATCPPAQSNSDTGTTGCDTPPPPPTCPPGQSNSGTGMTGMGAAPPPGGNGCGNTSPPGPGTIMSGLRTQAAFFDQTPGRYVIKVFTRGFRTPFSGLTDAGGYFFVPLIPQGETFTAVAVDTVTGKRRTFEGVGPAVGKSVLMFFDFLSDDGGPDELPIHWVGGAGGGDNKNWDDPLNWDAKIVPKEFHDVFIDTPGITVTHRLGTDPINTLHSNANLLLSGGSLSIAATSQISGALTLSAGTLGGAGPTTVNGGLDITGNFILNGVLKSTGIAAWRGGVLSGSGVLTNTGTLNISGSTARSFSGVKLANAGTINWSSTGSFQINSGSQLRNLASGLFDIQNDSTLLYAAGLASSFSNQGTVRKSAGAGTSALSVPFSGGTVEVLTGTLNLSGINSSTSGGDFTVASGAVLDLNGGSGTHTYTGSYTGTGAGTVRLNGGTLAVGAAGASFNFSGNLFQWSGGILSGSGVLTNTGTLNISGSAARSFSGLTLANAGTITWSSTGSFQINSGSQLRNLASGLFDIQSDATLLYAAGLASSFVNQGTVRKSAGAGTSALSVPLTNNGTIDAQSGTLNFSTLVNNGQISLGAAARPMAISGSFTQAAAGVLNIKIGGLGAGTQFDQISVGGSAALGGTLNISHIGGFMPGTGNSFQVLNYGSHSGAFASINSPGQTYTPSYSAANLTLTVP
jgi:hypothetical protein